MTLKQKKCWNCKHRTEGFKIGKLTHYHCLSPTYVEKKKNNIEVSPWDTLRIFGDTCDEHEFREKEEAK